MKGEQEFICIGCPMGCRIMAVIDDWGTIVKTVGQGCKEGKKYVQSEYTNPVRVLTTTVLVEGSSRRLLLVRTKAPIPKDRLQEAMCALARVRVKPPLKIGQTIVEDFLNTGVDVVACDQIL